MFTIRLRHFLCATALLGTTVAAQPTFSVTPVGPGCGPTLTASFSPIGGGNHRLDLALTGAWAGEHSLTYFGVQSFAFPLAGTACTLYTLPVWQLPQLIDATGGFTFQRSWNTSIVGHFILQTAVFRFDAAGTLQYELSNAVRVAHE